MNLTTSQITSSVAQAFDALAARHEQGIADQNLLHSSLYHAATWQAICGVVAGNKRCSILDLGGGNGIWTKRLLAQGHHVVYTDCSLQMAQLAYKNLAHDVPEPNIVQGDAQCLGFLPAGLFDVILAVGDLLSYVADPVLVYAESYRCCKPGGKFIVSCMGRYGMLSHLADTVALDEMKTYLQGGAWTEFQACELDTACRQPLNAKAYKVAELVAIGNATGWQATSFFGAGILRTLLGRERAAELIHTYGMTPVLELEQQLAQASLLDCAMEYGIVNAKPPLS